MTRARPLVLISLVLGGACRPDDPGEAAGPELLQMGADQVLVGMTMHLNRDGLRKARLFADTAYIFEELNESRYRNFTVIFFDEGGQEISEVIGVSGIYYDLSGDIEATGDIVVVDHRENQRLETDRLYYTAADDELTGDRPFEFFADGNTVYRGDRFISDPGLDAVRTYNPSGVSQGVRAPGGEAGLEASDDSVQAEAAAQPAATGAEPASPGAEADGDSLAVRPAEDSLAVPATEDSMTAPPTGADSAWATEPDSTRSDTTVIERARTVPASRR